MSTNVGPDPNSLLSEIRALLENAVTIVASRTNTWFDALEKMQEAQALTDRASILYGQLLSLRAANSILLDEYKLLYQDEYDKVVDKEVRNLGSLSWQERESVFRVKLLNFLPNLRQTERNLLKLNTTIEEADLYRKQLLSIRSHLAELTKTLQYGEK